MMKQNFSKKTLLAAVPLLLVLLMPAISFAQSPDDRFGLNEAVQGTGVIEGKDPIPLVVARAVQGVLSIVGVIFLILVIWGGAMWMTSGGNEKNISRAKQILTTATIGLVIIMTGYAITYFLIANLSGQAAQQGVINQGA
ncbi:MAG: hypothetical protein HY422_02560 [Candidatus Komeilibacteria bacterium]|nr:hypothetical protein [Candidatus Komeilibacteria bacterium]